VPVRDRQLDRSASVTRNPHPASPVTDALFARGGEVHLRAYPETSRRTRMSILQGGFRIGPPVLDIDNKLSMLFSQTTS
jgi:hypothetical protein